MSIQDIQWTLLYVRLQIPAQFIPIHSGMFEYKRYMAVGFVDYVSPLASAAQVEEFHGYVLKKTPELKLHEFKCRHPVITVDYPDEYNKQRFASDNDIEWLEAFICVECWENHWVKLFKSNSKTGLLMSIIYLHLFSTMLMSHLMSHFQC